MFSPCHRIIGTIALAAFLDGAVYLKDAIAQVPVSADNTTATQVTSADNLNFIIEQGTIQQGSLFHSFETFSVPVGGSAWFNNPPVANIFARVTGSSVTRIDGFLRANGSANLVLINPQGIQFGRNAFLNVGGSFLASTADAIVFNDNKQFSAVSPQAVPLLTVSTPVGLQFGNAPGGIQVQSGFFGLSVPNEQTLALVGGDVLLNPGLLTAISGRIEIGSVSNTGFVSLTPTAQPQGWQLGFDQITDFGDIQLLGEIIPTPLFNLQFGSRLTTSGDFTLKDVSGDISIWGRNITLSGGSILQAGNAGLLPGGDIQLNAAETVLIQDLPVPGVFSIPSGLFTSTVDAGPAGNIDINAKNFILSGETVTVSASSSQRRVLNGGTESIVQATGSAGNIQLNIEDSLTISDGAFVGAASLLGLGTSGQVTLNSRILNILRGGRVETFTTGPNPAGEILINATEQVSIDGVLPNRGTSSSLLSLSEQGATGMGGPITINTNRLSVTNGGIVSAQTNSIANAGKITVNANQVNLINGGQLISATSSQGAAGPIDLNVRNQLTIAGRDVTFADRLQQVDALRFDPFTSFLIIPIGVQAESGIISSALEGAMGPGGSIDIATRQLQITRQGIIASSTAGPGNAGRIDIRALEGIHLTDSGSGILANTTASGRGGSLTFTTPNFLIDKGAVVNVSTIVEGPGGSILVQADRFTARQGGQLLSTTSGQGPAGNITLRVSDNITLTGVNSGLFANTTGSGRGGSLSFATSNFLIEQGAVVNAETAADGPGGSISIQADRFMARQGGQLLSSASGQGPAGDITLRVRDSITLTGANSGLSADTVGIGRGGSLSFTTSNFLVDQGAAINASTTGDGLGGSIFIQANQFTARQGGQLLSATSGRGPAGNITLQVHDSITLAGANSGLFANTTGSGQGGNLSFTTSNFLIGQGAVVNASTAGEGPGGSIFVLANRFIARQGGRVLSTTSGRGPAGDITLRVRDSITLTGANSGLFANTIGSGQGGSLSFTTSNFLIEQGAVANVSTAGEGPGGSIFLRANRFTARQGGQLLSTASGRGPAGDITLQVRDDITLTGANSGIFADTTTGSSGAAGNIFIDPIQVLIADGAVVSATSLGTGKGGDIQLLADDLTLDRGQITAESAFAPAGNIELDIDNFLFLRNGSLISTTAGGDATGGNIDIEAQFIIAPPVGNSDITANALDGPGGRITITTKGIFGLEVRDGLTEKSDITAFSQNNPQLNGVVEIITPDVDPSDNLSEQPDTVEKPTKIERGCKAQVAKSSFVSKGRGGLPQNPAASLSSDSIWQDLRSEGIRPAEQSISGAVPQTTPQISESTPSDWVEAKGWQRLPNGKVRLIAQAINHYNPAPTAPC